ncbi:hypothetical protein [Thermopirellula anaerolimosa]
MKGSPMSLVVTLLLIVGGAHLGKASAAPPTSSLPAGAGLAAQYPGDHGIGRDPRVLLAEDFEGVSIETLSRRWEDVSNKGGRVLAMVPDSPAGSGGETSLEMTALLGENTGGHLYRRFRPVDKMFARFYVKFAEDCPYIHHFVHVGGYNPPTSFPQGGAGERPRGDERITVGIEPYGDYGRYAPPGLWNFYCYWSEMKISADGRYWGNGLKPARPSLVLRGRWQCVELMVQLNSDPQKRDGELALWLDGQPVAHFREGAPRSEWTGMGFTLKENGDPFEGFRWRTDAELKLNFFWLLLYVTENAARQNKVENPNPVTQVRFDNIVVAEDYIGPVAKAPD